MGRTAVHLYEYVSIYFWLLILNVKLYLDTMKNTWKRV